MLQAFCDFCNHETHILPFIMAQHYKGDISELELYFVIVNNEYGEQREEELLPGGKNQRVTNETVITFIHLVANHRLNFQVYYLLSPSLFSVASQVHVLSLLL